MADSNFKTIVSTYKNKVFNTCLGFVKNKEDAEDLAQEVFIEVYQKMDSFLGNSEIGTWLYRIAVNKSLESIRKKKRLKRSGEMEGIETNEAVSFEHPGIALENKERAAVLFKAIDLLPDGQKVAFTLQKLEGLTVSEIGKVMKKSNSSVESLLFRAKENLKKELKSYYEKNEYA